MLVLERFRTIAFICLSIFGCAGNLLTLIIIHQRFFRKTASAVFIFGLCIADCIVLCLHTLEIVAKDHPHVTPYECIIIFFIDVFRLLSVWIVCFINIERCSLVFNPCHMPRLTSRRKSQIFLLILFIISLLIFSHYGQHMYIAHVPHTNQTNSNLSYCAFKNDFPYFIWMCIKSSLNYWLTVPLCTICNIIIIKQLHQASRIERSLNYSSKSKLDLSSKQRQLTAMLVASSIGFVLTATPTTIHSVYILSKGDTSVTQYVIHIFTSILLHFHHASNFLVFLFSCGRFRLEVFQLFDRYLRFSICSISISCRRHSTPNREQMVFYSSKQQKTQVKLLSKNNNTRRRSTPNDLIQPTTNNYYRKNGRYYGPCVPTYYK
jgi:hypothetical protein